VARAVGVHQAFGAKTVLSGLDLQVEPGEVLGVLGPNGGGKSTLLTLLAGLVRPTAGQVWVGDLPADQVARRHTGLVGLITAEPGLYPALTGWENLEFFGQLCGLSIPEVRERGAALLAKLELGTDDLARRAGEYSSGMRQKVSLTRALLLRPRLLLLDEPTANLDPLASAALHEAVRDAADRGLGVVLVTHDLASAQHVCDRLVFVRQRVLGEVRGTRAPPPAAELLDFYRRWSGP
jgi:ABC-2 type transport system ATP-binding protein